MDPEDPYSDPDHFQNSANVVSIKCENISKYAKNDPWSGQLQWMTLRGYQRNALFLRPDESGMNTGMIFSGIYIS